MKLFAFGFGFTALRLVDIYADEFERISGTVRHAEKRDELHRLKLDAYLFDAVEHSEIASRIKEADVLLVSVPPGRSEDPVLSAFGQQIEASTARQVVYLSAFRIIVLKRPHPRHAYLGLSCGIASKRTGKRAYSIAMLSKWTERSFSTCISLSRFMEATTRSTIMGSGRP
jgi:hypothetical protein